MSWFVAAIPQANGFANYDFHMEIAINCDMQTSEPCNFCHAGSLFLTHHCTLEPCHVLMIFANVYFLFLLKAPEICTNGHQNKNEHNN